MIRQAAMAVALLATWPAAAQTDDMANPAFLWVEEGKALWSERPRPGAKSCADCHGAAETAMRGVAARHPAFDAKRGRAMLLTQRLDACRVEHQGETPFEPESRRQLGLAAYIALQSRGLPVAIAADGPLAKTVAEGRALYTRRIGQLDLSCAQCHDDLVGRRLAATAIPSGHVNAYPVYRSDWLGMGSFWRRLGNCTTGVRAEAFAPHSPEHVALESYLAARGNDLPMQAPGFRN
ncbi:MAG: sulfur oxidation c-type cytochrome SoxA [Alphaproteobacteria bacterium]|nr:sulfur oxidation c-type cytochrome SoxA [Alphaproteobacteria bacterium]